MKIGIIGTGHIGGTLADLWVKAGHEVRKIVLDTGNPYPNRDGPMAEEARRKGTGVASAEFLPGVRLVRASTPW